MFGLFHSKRSHADVRIGANVFKLLWERKTLPDAGAMQYAFETYGTPVYDFVLGNGATFIRRPLVETQPALQVVFAAPIISNPPINTFQGQFATQPLMNPNDAQALGITVDGSVPPDAYNLIPPAGPVLSP
jgi:hypothetical protein